MKDKKGVCKSESGVSACSGVCVYVCGYEVLNTLDGY